MILYTDINHHIGTPKQKQNNTTRYEFRSTIYIYGLRVVLDYSEIVIEFRCIIYICTKNFRL